MSSGFLPRLLAAGSRSSAPSLRQPCRPSSSRLLPALLVRRLSSSPRALDKAPEGSSLPASREGTAPARGSELLPQQPSHLSRLEDRSAPAFPPPALSTERNKLEAKRTKPLRKPRQKPEQPLSSSFATPGLEAAPNFALSHLPVASPSLAQSGQPAASEEERPQPPEAVAVSSPRTRVQVSPDGSSLCARPSAGAADPEPSTSRRSSTACQTTSRRPTRSFTFFNSSRTTSTRPGRSTSAPATRPTRRRAGTVGRRSTLCSTGATTCGPRGPSRRLSAWPRRPFMSWTVWTSWE